MSRVQRRSSTAKRYPRSKKGPLRKAADPIDVLVGKLKLEDAGGTTGMWLPDLARKYGVDKPTLQAALARLNELPGWSAAPIGETARKRRSDYYLVHKPKAADFRIVEGVSGTWFYHLGHVSKLSESLCGATTMSTNVPLRFWGGRTHMNERYCAECVELAKAVDPEFVAELGVAKSKEDPA